MRKTLLFIAILIGAFSSCGGGPETNESKEISGASLFKTHCAICHGENGRKGFADAKILPDSELSLEERIRLITNGKGTMMPYRGVLSEEEIEAVARFTLSLK
jgi:cytochrome c6